nr:MAG TPA: tail protein [Caudoviricetes sp.]
MGVYLGSTQVDMQGGFVTGGASGASLQSKTVSPSESAQTIKADYGYDGLSQVTVNAVSKTYVGSGVTKKSAATYTPGTSDQSIASGQYLNGTQTIKGDSNLTAGNIRNGVKIFNVTGSYAGSSSSGGTDTSDADATAANILSGKTAYVNGSKLTGTMTNNGAVSKTMTANGSYTIPAGYHNGSGKVTVNVSSSSGSSNNNIEAYAITNTNPSVSFKRTDGAIKIWGYGTMTSSSGWGGQTTSLIAFEGDRYYKSASWGSPSSTSLSLSISNGKLTGLPSELSAISAIVTRGI